MKHLLPLTLLAITLAPTTRAEDVIINAKKVYTVSGDVMEPGSVFISGGKIKAIGTS